MKPLCNKTSTLQYTNKNVFLSGSKYRMVFAEQFIIFLVQINFKAGREPEDPEIDDYDYYGDDYIGKQHNAK